MMLKQVSTHQTACGLQHPGILQAISRVCLLLTCMLIGSPLKEIASSPTVDPALQVTTADYPLIHTRPCGPDANIVCSRGTCLQKLGNVGWVEFCRCEKYHFGKHCEQFRPPVPTPDTGFVSPKQATILAGVIFLVVLFVVLLLIALLLSLRYFRKRSRTNKRHPKLGGVSLLTSDGDVAAMNSASDEGSAPVSENNNSLASPKTLQVRYSSLPEDCPQSNV